MEKGEQTVPKQLKLLTTALFLPLIHFRFYVLQHQFVCDQQACKPTCSSVLICTEKLLEIEGLVCKVLVICVAPVQEVLRGHIYLLPNELYPWH